MLKILAFRILWSAGALYLSSWYCSCNFDFTNFFGFAEDHEKGLFENFMKFCCRLDTDECLDLDVPQDVTDHVFPVTGSST